MTSSGKERKIALEGTFIGKIRIDTKPIAERLKDLVNVELAVLQSASSLTSKDGEKMVILRHIKRSLDENLITDNTAHDGDEIGRRDRFEFTPREWLWLSRQPDQSRWLKYLIYRYVFRIYPELKKLTDFPIYLLVEPASMCQLRCVMCFQKDENLSGKGNRENMGLIPWELFTRIVDEAAAKGCGAMTFAARGEPTIHKRFPEMLQYAVNAGILDVKANTHANNLTEEMIHRILASGVNEIVFSVDAATKETYEQIRVNGDFDKVVKNVRLFHEIRERDYPDSPTVTLISGCKVRDDQDIDQMTAFWGQWVDEVVIKEVVPRFDTYQWPINDVETACRRLWRKMYIWWDGSVTACDIDYLTKLDLGNVNRNTVQEVWLGPKMTLMRQNHLAGQRKCHMPCDRCPFS